ncbi:uncharacterized protein UTRI_06204_B [Ustilago trichophora]|uniref:Uncharacterized protein n=1 Tax=Ustilago trichophora TaxID=86804 RepID=A0A5C3EK55_9BASI|nr:uncharacterized protein UTRI_06204_B [Ustilago trichophora]
MVSALQMHLYFLLPLASFLLIVNHCIARQEEARRFRPPNAAARATIRAARAVRFAQIHLDQTLVHLEDHLDLPRRTLWPAWAYNPDQRDAVSEHLQSLHTRFQPVSDEMSRDYTVYASPVATFEMNSPERYNSLLIFRAYHNGQIQPIGFARVAPGIPEGHEVNLFTAVDNAARTTWNTLREMYGGVHVIHP